MVAFVLAFVCGCLVVCSWFLCLFVRFCVCLSVFVVGFGRDFGVCLIFVVAWSFARGFCVCLSVFVLLCCLLVWSSFWFWCFLGILWLLGGGLIFFCVFAR